MLTLNLLGPIFGVGGYTTQEHANTTYSNVPIQLNRDGDTNIIGFSMYFQRVNATTPGRLLFGGVETNKFTNTLETLQTPFSSDTLTYGNITAQLTNMSISSSTTTTPINSFANTQVILSAQVAGMYLPTAVLQQVLVQLNLSQAQVLTDDDFPNDSEGPLLPYDSAPNDTSIDLQFGAVQIRIPFWDIFLPYNATHGFLSLTEPGDGDQPLIGTSFFSNAYTVFDFTHNQISVAPLRHEALSEDNITPINSTGVAGLQGYVAQSSNPNNQTMPSSSGLSTGAKAGIGVGAALGALLVIGVIAFFVLRSRRHRRSQTNAHDTATNNTAYTATGPHDEENRKSAATYGQHSEKTELAGGSENTRFSSQGIPVSPLSDTHTFSTIQQDNMESMSASTFLGSDRSDNIKRKPVQVSELP